MKEMNVNKKNVFQFKKKRKKNSARLEDYRSLLLSLMFCLLFAVNVCISPVPTPICL